MQNLISYHIYKDLFRGLTDTTLFLYIGVGDRHSNNLVADSNSYK